VICSLLIGTSHDKELQVKDKTPVSLSHLLLVFAKEKGCHLPGLIHPYYYQLLHKKSDTGKEAVDLNC
jgi:hypothetical protein